MSARPRHITSSEMNGHAVHDVSDEVDESENETELPLTAVDALSHRAVFREWAAHKTIQITKQYIEQENPLVDSEYKSVTQLNKDSSASIITSPREYQLELFERAKKQNTIAVLDTGSGKTLISVLLLRHVLEEETHRRARGLPKRTAFFLVHSVTLVFQQASVLDANLIGGESIVGRFYGAMGCDLWDESIWRKHLVEYQVIVCTAEILNQCLYKGFCTMAQINLLILDEAHHARLNHPYANIMRGFYAREADPSRRPKIFAMTASPVNANIDITSAAEDLEAILHARIATTRSGSIGEYVHKPIEVQITYPRSGPACETPFYISMWEKFGELGVFKNIFARSKETARELGPWPSDMSWKLELGEAEALKAEARLSNGTQGSEVPSPFDREVQILHDALDVVGKHHFDKLGANAEHLSGKVLALHFELQKHFARPTATKCLVFVEKRTQARLLELIFQRIGGPFLHPGVVTGANSKRVLDMQMTLRQQVLTMTKFRLGEVNCLFATSVAEEGIDIPECNLVIRFDLCRTMIQYVQSRGRARCKKSTFVHMYEEFNSQHAKLISDVLKAEAQLRSYFERVTEDRLLQPFDPDEHSTTNDNFVGRRYDEKESSAVLTYLNAIQVLDYYVSTLPDASTATAGGESSGTKRIHFVVSPYEKGFVCEVILPDNAPIRSAQGEPYSRKWAAKRSAAFAMCIKLREAKQIDKNLRSVYRKLLPKLANAHLALLDHKTDYKMRLKPDLWNRYLGVAPRQLYVTIFDVSQVLIRPHRPLVLLTKGPICEIPEFPLFVFSDEATLVRSRSLEQPLVVTPDEVELLTSITLRVFDDVFAKRFERDSTIMSYFIAPTRLTRLDPRHTQSVSVDDLIDWELIWKVHHVREEECQWYQGMPEDELTDRFLVDRWSGARRAFSVAINHHLKPFDAVPEAYVPEQGKSSKRQDKNILETSISLWKSSRERWQFDPTQPVLEARLMSIRRNFLSPPQQPNTECIRAVLCPEPFRLSPLSTDFVAVCTILPSIIHRVEDYLIAMEVVDNFKLRIEPALALEAMTKDSDSSGDAQATKISFRPGMGKNYERLEFLGDCFLKMATSISLFGKNPEDDEFHSHCNRMNLICNLNLFQTATEHLQICENIRTKAFDRSLWYPDHLKLLSGKGKGRSGYEEQRHKLGDKTIADVCEAIIGAAFLQHNVPGAWEAQHWDDAVKAVEIFVKHEDHTMRRFQDYAAAYQKPAYQVAAPSPDQLELCERVRQKHDYEFKYPPLLASAFCHPSWPKSYAKTPSYQRLEWLGDALLDMVFVSHIFYNYPTKDPQWLTEHKGAMVGNKFLAAVCVKLGFHRYLQTWPGILSLQISEWAEAVKEAEESSGGAMDYWTHVKAAPKCLADMVEAYVAAVFIDSNFDYNEVQRFFDIHIKPFFEDMTLYDNFAKDHPINRLVERLSVELGCNNFRVMSDELRVPLPGARKGMLAGVMVHGQMYAQGVSGTSKGAKGKAASAMFELLDGLAPFQFAERYGCDCRSKCTDDTIAT